jgi:hypothetical protein
MISLGLTSWLVFVIAEWGDAASGFLGRTSTALMTRTPVARR